jgi:hypothetical protein
VTIGLLVIKPWTIRVELSVGSPWPLVCRNAATRHAPESRTHYGKSPDVAGLPKATPLVEQPPRITAPASAVGAARFANGTSRTRPTFFPLLMIVESAELLQADPNVSRTRNWRQVDLLFFFGRSNAWKNSEGCRPSAEMILRMLISARLCSPRSIPPM